MRTKDDWRHILGTGHWEAARELDLQMSRVREVAAEWSNALRGVALPWLCWNVDPAWCLVQQKLIKEVGWTPVVGFDPRVGPPPLVDGAICIDFNEHFQLPTMWLHFPLEFAFLYCDRLAFWHADLILPRDKMKKVAAQFAAMPDGTAAAVVPTEGWRRFLPFRYRRYWEVLGCTTRGASRSQFEQGSGWWMNFWMHPSTPAGKAAKRSKFYYDSGTGIWYWRNKLNGPMLLIPEAFVDEGHCTRMKRTNYIEASPNNFKRDLSKELSLNTDLSQLCNKFGLGDLLPVLPAPPSQGRVGDPNS